jgi:hypothetical protein
VSASFPLAFPRQNRHLLAGRLLEVIIVNEHASTFKAKYNLLKCGLETLHVVYIARHEQIITAKAQVNVPI